MDFDPEISELDLTVEEKNGLQLYKNYHVKFTTAQIKQFSKKIDERLGDLIELERCLAQIESDDVRLIPVIACAFIDDVLKDMYKREIPQEVPGGRDALFSQYGPLSTLAHRVRLAHAFDLLTPEIVQDIENLKNARNKISHTWKIDNLNRFFIDGPASRLVDIENKLSLEDSDFSEKMKNLDDEDVFRMRVSWVISRLYYEAQVYGQAKREGLPPRETAFGEHCPNALGIVSAKALRLSHRLVRGKSDS